MPRSGMKKQCHGTLVTDALHVTRVIADSLSCAQVYDVLVGLLTSLRVQYVNSTDHCVPCTARTVNDNTAETLRCIGLYTAVTK